MNSTSAILIIMGIAIVGAMTLYMSSAEPVKNYVDCSRIGTMVDGYTSHDEVCHIQFKHLDNTTEWRRYSGFLMFGQSCEREDLAINKTFLLFPQGGFKDIEGYKQINDGPDSYLCEINTKITQNI